jgi:hypothetical protein
MAFSQAQENMIDSYRQVIADTVAMVNDAEAQRLASQHGLNILNVTWEDTGRFKGSAVGPNISDVTIQVQHKNPTTGQYELALMPVIRFPNFSDKTGDVPLDSFFLLVGNHKQGEPLHRITLKQLLANPRAYMSSPDSWKGSATSLLAERDTHALVSAQACFLPVPKRGMAEFNPVIFNYQSSSRNPAVLTILATRQGTSMTIIDNQRDGFAAGRTWGQRLFFNKAGERASLTGQRLSDFAAQQTSQASIEQTPQATDQGGLNLVLIVQVPLKHKERPPMVSAPMGMAHEGMVMSALPRRSSDVESAVIGHGNVEGPFTEFDNLPIERDPRFPVRVTVQFYKATSNGAVNESDLSDIARQISRVYEQAEYVGSLVVCGETARPTEHDGPKVQPPDWWDDFWRRHEANTGQSREQALDMLRKLRGDPDFSPRTPEEAKEALRRIDAGG